MVFFSVILPAYNVAPYLRECLNSLRSQTFTDWEAICIDDGSTDGSGEILDEFAKCDSRFKVIHDANHGVCHARNVGLEKARGEWICFLDGDDVLEAEWLSKAYEEIIRHKPHLLRMCFKYWYPSRDEPFAFGNQEKHAEIGGRACVASWGWRVIPAGGWICVIFVDAAVLSQSGMTFCEDLKVREDSVFLLSLLPYVSKVVQCEYDGYRYRMRLSSACHGVRRVEDCSGFITSCLSLWERQKNNIRPSRTLEDVQDKLGRCFWGVLLDWLERRDVEGRDTVLRESLLQARQIGVLNIKSLRTKWRIAGVCFILTHSLVGFYAINLLVGLYLCLFKRHKRMNSVCV